MSSDKYLLSAPDGKSYPVGPNGLSIGSSPTNDVVVRDGQATSRHARILLAGGRCWVRQESGMGITLVNGKRLVGQGELHAGDTVQIGATTFRLIAPKTAVPLSTQKRRNLVFLGMGAIVIIALLLIIGSGGVEGPTPGLFGGTHTPTPVVVMAAVATDLPTAEAAPSATVPLAATPTPVFAASISCSDVGLAVARHTCTVKNLGSITDTLWLSFAPYRISLQNGFSLSVDLGGEAGLLRPSRRGLIELGAYTANQENTFVLQMFCVDTLAGCPSTAVRVQVLANDGDLPIYGPPGEIGIYNSAEVEQPKPTRRPPSEPGPTSPPASAATSTPSDAVGPTETP